jgi:hypothetical protein
VVCTTIAGVGRQLAFQVTVGTLVSASFGTAYNYQPPAVTTVTYPGGGLATLGGDNVVLSEFACASDHHFFLLKLFCFAAGTSFGPFGTPNNLIGASFGPLGTEFVCTTCAVNSQTQITCTTPISLGNGHRWSLSVAAQVAPLTTAGPTHTAKTPTVTTITATQSIVTNGGTDVTLAGTNVSGFVLPDACFVGTLLNRGLLALLSLVLRPELANGLASVPW